jgi:hypothetical protein
MVGLVQTQVRRTFPFCLFGVAKPLANHVGVVIANHHHVISVVNSGNAGVFPSLFKNVSPRFGIQHHLKAIGGHGVTVLAVGKPQAHLVGPGH